MALADALSIDGNISEVKSDLMAAYQTIIGAGQEYAKMALASASVALEVAYSGGVCAAVYKPFYDFHHYTKLANASVISATRLSNVLAAVSESGDDEADAAYAGFLMDLAQTDHISSLLEGANRRIEMASASMPKDPQPAARFDRTIYDTSDA